MNRNGVLLLLLGTSLDRNEVLTAPFVEPAASCSSNKEPDIDSEVGFAVTRLAPNHELTRDMATIAIPKATKT
jgi:hypothetical protein